jgi:tetratricopeptide (TPR) repeat protein
MGSIKKRVFLVKISYQDMSILIVDSVPTGIDTLASYVQDFNFYRVHSAKSVDEAFKVLRDDRIDLVISAWKMQPISGFQLLESIRTDQQHSDIPVLLMIDRHDKHLEDMGLKGGASGFLNLPLQMKAVVSTIEQVLEPFIDADDEEFLRHYADARKATRDRKWDKAIKEFKAALAVKEDTKARLAMARAFKQMGEMDEAQNAFKDVMKQNPDSLAAYSGLASVLQEEGRLHDALKVLMGAEATAKRLEESGQTNAGIHFYMGEIELQLKMVKEALAHFKQASEEDSENTELQVNIGDALLNHGLDEQSEEYYKKALDMDPELAHVYNRLGIAYRKQKKYDLAIELYKKALKVHPEDEHLLYNMARSYWEMNRLDDAITWLKKALELNPKFKEAKAFIRGIEKQKEQEAAKSSGPVDDPDQVTLDTEPISIALDEHQ